MLNVGWFSSHSGALNRGTRWWSWCLRKIGAILLEELEGERLAWELMRGCGPGRWQRAGLVTGTDTTENCSYKSLVCRCYVIAYWDSHSWGSALVSFWASDSILEKSIFVSHPIFSSQCVSQLVGGLLLSVFKFFPVWPSPERKHWPPPL